MAKACVSPAAVSKSRKKLARRERQARQQERASLVAAANATHDLLANLESFRRFEEQGLDVSVECVRGSELCPADLAFCTQLVQDNMGGLYQDAGWALSSKSKRRDLSDSGSWVLLMRTVAPPAEEAAAPDDDRGPPAEEDWVLVEHPLAESAERLPAADPQPRERNLGFVHLQFCVEAERPVLYVLELQLVPEAQGKGLGQFAMQLVEVLARQFGMASLMLTVFKKNSRALDFYREKLRYSVDETSPSRCDRRDESYEILSKSTEFPAKAEGEEAATPAAAC